MNAPAKAPAAPSTSVVICAYTEQRWTEACASIDSVLAQSYPDVQPIVVVDHNPALLARFQQRYPEVIVVPNARARGLSGARNTGVALATGEFVAFLDDDAFAPEGWLTEIVGEFTDEVAVAGGAILPVWAVDRPRWFPEEFNWVIGCSWTGLPTTTAEVRNVVGANMVFRRRVFEVAGNFRDGVGRTATRPLGCEETELCIRATQAMPGASVVYVPAAAVHHHVGAARARFGYFLRRCFAEGISKAHIGRTVGSGAALSNERRYVARVLPAGVLTGLRDTVAHRRPDGALRAAAIVAGLATTVLGYTIGSFTGGNTGTDA